MSEALAFLVKARPAAMAAYFAFLKDAGSRLDPKTRNLISVITKVHARTENGLRQYVARALREGASAEELLDALLMAFPALGLAKIVWAVDVILRMDLPEFRALGAAVTPGAEASGAVATGPGAPGAEATGADASGVEGSGAARSAAPAWHDVVAVADLGDGRATRLECGGRGLFVWRNGQTIRVYDSRCPHQATDIPELSLAGDLLTCPKHQWSFDIASGRCTAKGDRPLRTIPHRVAEGRLLARW